MVTKKSTKSPAKSTTKFTKGGNIKQTSLAVLGHVVRQDDDGRDVGISYESAAQTVRELHGSNTTVGCLRWYAAKARAGKKGYEAKLPQIREKSAA